jgi:hypothetical protein
MGVSTATVTDFVMVIAVCGVPLIYATLQLIALIVWRRTLRWAAMLPLIGWGVWIAIQWGNEAHRLALADPGPIEPAVEELIFQSFVGSFSGLAFLGLLLLVHRLRKRERRMA